MDLKGLETIAVHELRKHGLHGWTFDLADTGRRLGVCNYGTKRIEIEEFPKVSMPVCRIPTKMNMLWVRIKPAQLDPAGIHPGSQAGGELHAEDLAEAGTRRRMPHE